MSISLWGGKLSAKYIIRLDDACPTMKRSQWDRFEAIFNEFEVKPIIAVIPNNKDESLMVDGVDPGFWLKVRRWQKQGWHIALHGYEHLYTTKNSGLVSLNKKSEFSGLSYQEQRKKIEKGISVFKKHNIKCNLWVAPSHSFDVNTIKALREVTDIDVISDGISFFPYKAFGMKWIPQQLWIPKKKPFGVWTICVHPETAKESQIKVLADFIKSNKEHFICLDSLRFTRKNKNIIEIIYTFYFLKKRALMNAIYNKLYKPKG